MPYLVLVFFTLSSWASLQTLKVQNADLDYQRPQGKGTVDEIRLSLKSLLKSMPIEVHRTETSLDLMAPMLGLEWVNPPEVLHDMENLWLEKLTLNLGKKAHNLSATKIRITPDQKETYSLTDLRGQCLGESTQEKLQDRLLEDCVNDLSLKVEKLDIPLKSILFQILESLPRIPEGEEVPVSALELLIKKGDFELDLRLKMILGSTLHAWGHLQFEQGKEVLAIRLDKVKYGILPVTGLVFSQLRQRVKDPDITIDEPWIRIKL